jgi:hypothetical protein
MVLCEKPLSLAEGEAMVAGSRAVLMMVWFKASSGAGERVCAPTHHPDFSDALEVQRVLEACRPRRRHPPGPPSEDA